MRTVSHTPKVVVAPGAGLDHYALRLERIRGEIAALSRFNSGIRHTVPVVALFITSTPPASGQLDIAATWVAPTGDPELGATLLCAGLLALRAQAPGVFEQAIARLRAEAEP
jgi:hypothetical protein